MGKRDMNQIFDHQRCRERILGFRRNGLSWREIGTFYGVSHTTLWRIARGEANASARTMERILSMPHQMKLPLDFN